LLPILAVATVTDAPAYEIDTHVEVLTRQAVSRSVVQRFPDVLRDLGIEKSLADQRFPNSNSNERSIRQLLEDCARFEDIPAPTVRVLRHFYSPVNGTGLVAPGLGVQTASPRVLYRPAIAVLSPRLGIGIPLAIKLDRSPPGDAKHLPPE
jgi:hypothetical protein